MTKLVPLDSLRSECPDARLSNLKPLVDSIRNEGLLTPLVVTPVDDHYRVLQGARRHISLVGLRAMRGSVYDRATGTQRPATEVFDLVPVIILVLI